MRSAHNLGQEKCFVFGFVLLLFFCFFLLFFLFVLVEKEKKGYDI